MEIEINSKIRTRVKEVENLFNNSNLLKGKPLECQINADFSINKNTICIKGKPYQIIEGLLVRNLSPIPGFLPANVQIVEFEGKSYSRKNTDWTVYNAPGILAYINTKEGQALIHKYLLTNKC
jgi:hypothetical protein